ncbi:MAG: sigma-70 family RNA polymerase sigma factor, partial [Elusimicrobiota bacterium]
MEPKAFADLLRQAGDKAYNFAYRLAGNEQDARDLVQEAFARALEHAGSYDPSRAFDSWLLRILHNIFLDGVRRLTYRRTVSLDAPTPVADSSWED